MSAAMPYVKWHGRDWLGDPMLRMVKPEVRGVWIDLLCAMMNSEPYGHLAVAGNPMSDEQAARLTGLDIDTFKGILKGIEDAGISSRTDTGMLYSRRLVRDYNTFLKASASGKRGGGNPALKHSDSESRIHSPEARSQKPEAKDPIKGAFIGTLKGCEAFGRFWDTYPRKTGKKAALHAWSKAGDKPDIEEIVTAIEAQKQSAQWQKDGGQFIPHPATWLNQGRWDDDPEIGERCATIEEIRARRLERERKEREEREMVR